MLPQVEARCDQSCTQEDLLAPAWGQGGQGPMEKSVEFELVWPAHAVMCDVYIYLQQVRCYLN